MTDETKKLTAQDEYNFNKLRKLDMPIYKIFTPSNKHQNTRRLENIAGGPLQLNEDGTFDLTVINSYLNEHKLELEIVYFANENRLGFSIYRTDNPLTEEVKKFSDEGDFHSVKDHIFPFLKHESKHIKENQNEIIISGVRYNYTPKKTDKK